MFYCVSKTSDTPGKPHEIHKEGCPRYPSEENRVDLGHFNPSFNAAQAAKKIYKDANGCLECSPELNYG